MRNKSFLEYATKILWLFITQQQLTDTPTKDSFVKMEIWSQSYIPLNLGFPRGSVSLVGLELKSVILPENGRYNEKVIKL